MKDRRIREKIREAYESGQKHRDEQLEIRNKRLNAYINAHPPEEKDRHAHHSRAYRREKAQKRHLEDVFTGREEEVIEPTPSSSSTDWSNPPRTPTPPPPFKFDRRIPLSIYWDEPGGGLHPREWTSVSGIGRGEEWGTGKLNGYDGIMYSEPQPITKEEGEVDYVVEKAYYIEKYADCWAYARGGVYAIWAPGDWGPKGTPSDLREMEDLGRLRSCGMIDDI
jgi:hypothetical protein